jgi:hypothetical protein
MTWRRLQTEGTPMRHMTHGLLRALRWRAGLLLAIGLMLGGGAPGAAAADPPAPPTLQWVRVDPPAAVVYQFNLNGDAPVNGVRLNVYQNNRFVHAFQQQLSPADRDGKVTNPQNRSLFKSNTRYCVGLLAYVGTGNNSSSTFSEESERQCFTIPPYADEVGPAPKPASEGAPKPAPAPEAPPPPTKPDLTVTRLTGPTEVFDGVAVEYEVAIWNDGTPAQGTAQVAILAEGPLESIGVLEVTNNGFVCEARTSGFTCVGSLGGVDDAVQTRGAAFRVQVRGNGSGEALVRGSINHDRSLDEMSTDNNIKQLIVTVK